MALGAEHIGNPLGIQGRLKAEISQLMNIGRQMTQSEYSDSQIKSISTQTENGGSVADHCREHAMSSASFYKWRAE